MSRIDDMFNNLLPNAGNIIGSIIMLFILVGVWLTLAVIWVGFVVACVAGWINVTWMVPVVAWVVLAIPAVLFIRK